MKETAMNAGFSGGSLRFRPGRRDAISGTRRALANALLRGRDADEAPRSLAALYSLCGESHRIASQLAIDAARGRRNKVTGEERARLARETLREHVMRMWIDWPRLLGGEADVAALRAFPLLKQGATARDAVQWVRDAMLGEDIDDWLSAWHADPESCLAAWAERGATAPARLLANVSGMARSLEARSLPLLPHGDSRTLESLAAAMATEQDFEVLPEWHGCCCETGTWNRLANAARSLKHYGGRVWYRLGARVAEAALLASGKEGVLSAGSLQLSHGQGIAWCEMARGLLLHRVHVERSEGHREGQSGRQDVIADYRIVAPTEWNFHPRGAAADMLVHLPASRDAGEREDMLSKVNVIAAAFDPCVAFEVEAGNA
jgi:hypothetical protein